MPCVAYNVIVLSLYHSGNDESGNLKSSSMASKWKNRARVVRERVFAPPEVEEEAAKEADDAVDENQNAKEQHTKELTSLG